MLGVRRNLPGMSGRYTEVPIALELLMIAAKLFLEQAIP